MSRVLFITLDDVGIEFLRNIYNEGPPQTAVDLPAIEALASQGMVLENFYSNPSCTPTRASALTGRTARQVNLGDFLTSGDDEYLAPTWMTIPKLAGQAVTSCHVGKWHLGVHAGSMDPIGHGFHLHAGTEGNVPTYTDWDWRRAVPGFHEEQHRGTYVEDDLLSDALGVLQSLNIAGTADWFVWVSLHLPHGPYHYPPGMSGDGTKLDQYKKMLQRADEMVGDLLSVLPEDVYVCLWSDNGSEGGVASTPGRKMQVREGGINVPCIWRGPGIAPLSRTVELAQCSDLMATTVDLLDGRAIGDPTVSGHHAPASTSLLGMLAGGGSGRVRTYSERFRLAENLDLRASRGARYKLERTLNAPGQPDGERMFDLLTAAPGTDGVNLLGQGTLPPAAAAELPNLRAVLDSCGAVGMFGAP